MIIIIIIIIYIIECNADELMSERMNDWNIVFFMFMKGLT